MTLHDAEARASIGARTKGHGAACEHVSDINDDLTLDLKRWKKWTRIASQVEAPAERTVGQWATSVDGHGGQKSRRCVESRDSLFVGYSIDRFLFILHDMKKN